MTLPIEMAQATLVDSHAAHIASTSPITPPAQSVQAQPVQVQPVQAPPAPAQPPASGKAVAPASAPAKRSRLADDKRFKIFCGSANRPLCEEVCRFLGVPMGETRMQSFSDGEIHFQLLENVRGADVFLMQPTSYPVDQHLVELLIMIDALKRASAGRITVVIPYYGYARQDRKDRPRVAISPSS